MNGRIIVEIDFECPRCGCKLRLLEKGSKTALKCPRCGLKAVWRLNEVSQMVLRNGPEGPTIDFNDVLCELYLELSIKSLIGF